MTPYLTPEEYAELLGVSKSWVQAAVTARRIHFTPVGRLTRFSEADIAANEAEWHKAPIAAPSGVTSIRSRRQRSAA